MTTRVIALDLDGTLLTPKKTLLPSSIEALARAREAGYQLIIVTGRHHVAIHPFYQALALDTPAICCNGTYLYDYHAKTVLEADPMPVNKALQLIEMLNEHHIHGLMYVDDAMVYEHPTGHVIRTSNWAQTLPPEQRHMVFHPNEQYAYCVNELNSSVDVWELKDPHGNIECVQTLDMMPENFSDTRWAADIHITPDGRHLYACDRTASLITVFSVSEDGSVLSKEGFQPTETQPRGFNVDHSGKYLIAAGQKSHHISVYEIVGEQGLLHEKGRYAVGQGPMWVVVNAH